MDEWEDDIQRRLSVLDSKEHHHKNILWALAQRSTAGSLNHMLVFRMGVLGHVPVTEYYQDTAQGEHAVIRVTYGRLQ